jgi:nucleotide-binding universal stress UspA family protein
LKEILVAVDGSKHSERIVDFAADMAKSLSATVLLIFVMPRSEVPEDYLDYAKRESMSSPIASYLGTVAEQIIAKLGERIRRRGVEYEGVYYLGSPAEKIVETAESRKVGLVVVGVRGLHSVDRIRALGSVSRRVIENSGLPVLVVP